MSIKVTYGEYVDIVHNGFTFLKVDRSVNLINQSAIYSYAREFTDEIIEKKSRYR